MNTRFLMAVGMFSIVMTIDARAGIVSTTGAVKTIAPPADIRTGKLESDTQIVAFAEQTGVSAQQAVALDVTSSGTIDPTHRALSPGAAPAGSTINSYYLHYDKIGDSNAAKSGTGSITFEEDIIGYILNADMLVATNEFPGLSATKYADGTIQGIELDAAGTFITLGGDRRTLSFNLSVTCCADNIRVITGDSGATQNPGITAPSGQAGGAGQIGGGFLSGLCGAGGPGLGLVTPLMLTAWMSARRHPGRRGATGRHFGRPIRKH